MESTPRCTPKGVAEIADKFPNLTIIAAHLGGVKEVDETLEYLAGKPGKIFFDTGIVSYYMTVSQAEQIIKKHGADRVLFASDCPWGDPKNIIEAINQMSLSDNEKDMIFYKNAEKLLGIKATV
jgi:predicted TIM-barrel fold metal-dependent hydrolase